jgi:uncharacterized protein (DUF1778 family)
MAVAARTERTEARLLPEQKRRIEHAASIKGISISDFLVQTADEAAIRTIEQHENWILSNKDRDAFLAALLNPPDPTPRLSASFKRYRKSAPGR